MDTRRKPKPKPLPGSPSRPEEGQHTADGLPWLTPEDTLSAVDMDMIVEEVSGNPLRYGSPQAAIEAMERRLAILKAQKARNLAAQENCDQSLRQALLSDLDELNREIAATEQRLDGYRFQHRHEN